MNRRKRDKKVFLNSERSIREELDNYLGSDLSSDADDTDEDPDFSPVQMNHDYSKGKTLTEILNRKTVKRRIQLYDSESDDDNNTVVTKPNVMTGEKSCKATETSEVQVNIGLRHTTGNVVPNGIEENNVFQTNKGLPRPMFSSKCSTSANTPPSGIQIRPNMDLFNSSNGLEKENKPSNFPVNIGQPMSTNVLQTETQPIVVQGDLGYPAEVRPTDLQDDVGVGPPPEVPDAVNSMQKRAKRGLSNPQNWKRNKNKKARLSGEAFCQENGIQMPSKECNLNNCTCALKCHEKITEDARLRIFNHFYKTLSTKNEQNAFLVGSIVQFDKKRSYVTGSSRREKTRTYYLKNNEGNDVRVCKQFFQKTLQVSAGRLDRAIKGFNELGVPKPDGRGRHEPKNKRKEEDIQFVVDFINTVPRYKSHYTRKKNPDKEFFSPGLNYSKLYGMYCEKCKEMGLKEVSLSIFKDEMKRKFNIGFHKPIKDSCKTCDTLHNKIKVACEEDKVQLEMELECHHQTVETCNEIYENDKNLSRTNKDTTVVTFDLMKTLPTPHLSTGIVYYKRQLWTFCFGIHDAEEGNAFMKVWDESKASRGSTEVASCILHYLKMKNVHEEIIAWSDACGGQNRNIYIALFWLYVVTSEDFNVNKIKHKFFVSGHSYNDCDKDFGLVEKNKPDSGIFVPSQWADVIRGAKKKNPFIVNEMDSFFDFKLLKEWVTHRKLDTNGEKVSWLNMALIEVRRDSPYSIFFKYNHAENAPYHELDIAKFRPIRQFGPPVGPVGAQTLRNVDKSETTITEAKVADLKSLLPLIPPIHHEFYSNLVGDKSKEWDTLPGVEEEEEED